MEDLSGESDVGGLRTSLGLQTLNESLHWDANDD
jgi:hypothetical protein